jgi:hypothetical protein
VIALAVVEEFMVESINLAQVTNTGEKQGFFLY